MSPKEKNNINKRVWANPSSTYVYIYIDVYVYTHTYTAPFLGCDVWKPPPPSQKKGGRQPSSPKQNSEVLKPSKNITCSICFFNCGCRFNLRHFPPRSCWKLPSLIQHSTNVPGSRFHLLFFNVFFLKVKLYQVLIADEGELFLSPPRIWKTKN